MSEIILMGRKTQIKKSIKKITFTKDEPRPDKTNKVSVRPAKTQISLGISPVWSESSLCTQWVAKKPSFLHADSWALSLHCPPEEGLGPLLPIKCTVKTQIRLGDWMARQIWDIIVRYGHFVGIWLGRCPGWSEYPLGAHSLCWFCHVAAQIIFLSIFRFITMYQWAQCFNTTVSWPPDRENTEPELGHRV